MKVVKILNILLAVLIVGVSLFGYHMIPEFIKMYESISIDIQQFFLTQIIIVSYQFWVFSLIIPIFIYVKFLYKKINIKKSTKIWLLLIIIILIVFLTSMFPFISISLYLPIIDLK